MGATKTFETMVPSPVGGGTRVFVAATLVPVFGLVVGDLVRRLAQSTSLGVVVGVGAAVAGVALVLTVGRRERRVTITVGDDAVCLHGVRKTRAMALESLASIRELNPRTVLLTDINAQHLLLTAGDATELATEIAGRVERHAQGPTIRARVEANAAVTDALLKKPAFVTHVVTGLMATAFAVEAAMGALTDNRMMTLLGGNSRELLLLGQLNRLVVANFLHGSLMHVLMNASSMQTLGSTFERWASWRQLVPILFISSVVGMGCAALVNNALIVGMSTGLYGLLGAAAVTSYTYRKQRLEGVWFSPRQWVQLGVINGLINLLPSISTAGHVGGFVGGVFAALAFLKTPSRPALVSDRGALIASALAVVLTLAAFAATVIQAR